MSDAISSENRLEIRPIDDEWVFEAMLENGRGGNNCAGCRRECLGRVCCGPGEAALDCAAVLIVDRVHYRLICSDCYASFGKPRSTAEGIFGL